MKPIKQYRKLQLHKESVAQLTPDALTPAQLKGVVGGTDDGMEASFVCRSMDWRCCAVLSREETEYC